MLQRTVRLVTSAGGGSSMQLEPVNGATLRVYGGDTIIRQTVLISGLMNHAKFTN